VANIRANSGTQRQSHHHRFFSFVDVVVVSPNTFSGKWDAGRSAQQRLLRFGAVSSSRSSRPTGYSASAQACRSNELPTHRGSAEDCCHSLLKQMTRGNGSARADGVTLGLRYAASQPVTVLILEDAERLTALMPAKDSSS